MVKGIHMKNQIKVNFPFTGHFEDYHEGSYVAKVLKQITGRRIVYQEKGFDKRGYKFIFDVVPVKDEDEDTFSRDKESFIAP